MHIADYYCSLLWYLFSFVFQIQTRDDTCAQYIKHELCIYIYTAQHIQYTRQRGLSHIIVTSEPVRKEERCGVNVMVACSRTTFTLILFKTDLGSFSLVE